MKRVLIGGTGVDTGLPLSEAQLHEVQSIMDERERGQALVQQANDPKRWPFQERVEHTTVKNWLDWYKHHGAKLRGTSRADAAEYFRSEIDRFFTKHVTKEQRLVFARELGFAQEWAESGFPQIVVADGLFASLAATRVPAEAVPDLGLPWECFVVRIPDRFRVHQDQFYVAPDGKRTLMRIRLGYMRVRRNFAPHDFERPDLGRSFKDGERCGWELRFVPEVMPFGGSQAAFLTMSELLGECGATVHVDHVGGDMQEVSAAFDEDREESHQRIDRALRRAFVGTMLEIMSPKSHAGGGGSMSRRRGAELPTQNATIVLRRNVIVDCRDWLDNHLRGDEDARRVLSVQTLVRGHWKRQACGVSRSERKFIHVEPYWRGPEDAPIAVRSHILGAKGEAAE